MEKVGIILSLVGILLLTSCKSKKPEILSQAELQNYIGDKENGLTKEQEVNGTKVKLSYFPWQMLATQELNQENKNDTGFIRQLEAKYNQQYYFKLKFSRGGGEAIRQLGSYGKYSEMVQVLAFRMNDYINLTTPKRDTIEMADYFFDQTYGMSDGNTLLLSFPKEKIKDNKTIDINIGECGFGTGALKFTFEQDAIETTPKLSYTIM